jgi:hypothetical protein
MEEQPVPRRSSRACTLHPLSQYTGITHLKDGVYHVASAITSTTIPRDFAQASRDLRWQAVMDEEIQVLQPRQTWDLVSCLNGAIVVDYRWVYTIKYRPDGTVDKYKARLVAKGFT